MGVSWRDGPVGHRCAIDMRAIMLFRPERSSGTEPMQLPPNFQSMPRRLGSISVILRANAILIVCNGSDRPCFQHRPAAGRPRGPASVGGAATTGPDGAG